jgi:two-component system chemotaxis sensor kinase CheA
VDSFELELKNGFLEEASQLLGEAEQCFLNLEKQSEDPSILEKIFRLAHNIKGSSKAVGFDSLGAFTHEFESFLLKCKNGLIPITGPTVSLLLKGNDHICRTIEALKADASAVLDNGPLIQEMLDFAADPANAANSVTEAEAAPADTAAPPPEDDTFSVDDAKLYAEATGSPAFEGLGAITQASLPPATAVEQVEVSTPVAAAEPVAHASAPVAPAAGAAPKATPPAGGNSGPPSDESIRVSLARLERLLNFVGELVILQTVLREQSFSGNLQLLRKTVHQMGKVTKEVQDLSMSLRMIPIKQTFQKMQRIVRDTSSILGKKVELVLEGEETEVDKTVLEALGDPLVHLIRNAVDHGIESPEDRVATGKSDKGRVALRAFHQSGKLVIEIRDDGAGISADRLRKKAVEKGILKPGATISDTDAVHLIFHPGFSTKAQVTEVSGRGVGMDVVKTNIENMQGEVTVETEVGKGSVFKIMLPLTLAIIDGMVVRCGNDRFVIPLSHVHESLKPGPNDIQKTTGIGEVLILRGENLPVVRLDRILHEKAKLDETKQQIAIIVRTEGQPFAALVDDIIGQHQVVIKKLGSEIQHIKGFSGSAVLGDGKPALILELGELVNNRRHAA